LVADPRARLDPDHTRRIGIEELALTGALVAFGADNAKAVAATLIYRFLTVAPILPLGLLAAGTYKVGKPRSGLAT
jgi:uncharacterized membrane protein YbhN (UPF0104 family)